MGGYREDHFRNFQLSFRNYGASFNDLFMYFSIIKLEIICEREIVIVK